MDSQSSPSRVLVVAPEGEHFEFDEDGERLRLVVVSRRDAWRRVGVGVATIVLFFLAIRLLSFGEFLYVPLGLFALLMLWLSAQAWFGFESTEISATEILHRRYLFPFSRVRTLARPDCTGIGIVPERPIHRHDDELAEPEIVGTTKGRIAFVGATGKLLDFGNVLTEQEARLVRDFLCKKMPDLEVVAIRASDVYGTSA